MSRTTLIAVVAVVAVAVSAAVVTRSRTRPAGDIGKEEAAAALRAEAAFTTREGSAVGRELVDIVAIRRIGRGSCEVEFTWRDAANRQNAPATPPRSAMALFRLQNAGRWRLTSLFRVD